MIRVNLIPESIRNSQGRDSHLHVWIVITAACASVFLAWAGIKYMTYLEVDQKWVEVNHEYQELNSKVNTLSKTESQLDKLQDRLAINAELSGYPDLLEIVAYLTLQTPADIYLNDVNFGLESDDKSKEFSDYHSVELPKVAKLFALKQSVKKEGEPSAATVKAGDAPMKLVITGKSQSLRTVGQYLKVLEDSGFFDDLILNYSKRDTSTSTSVYEFEISCVINVAAASQTFLESAYAYQ